MRNIQVEKQTHRFMIISGAVLAALGTGACHNESPDQTPAGGTAPVSLKPVRPGQVAGSPMTGPGAAAKAGSPRMSGKPAPAVKGGKTPGMPAMARGARDPFQAAGARQAAPGGTAAAPGLPLVTPAPQRVLVYRGRRQDPFFIDWKLPVPPPYVFDEVEPIRVASAGVVAPPSQPVEVREQPEMRVSGIMTGDGVFAILESGGKVDVVKPGSSVDIPVGGQTNRTYRVVSITKEKVRLRSQVGNYIYTQEVPLSDVAVGTPARMGMGGPGGPGGGFGGPGSGGPGGGFPGQGGRPFGPGGGGGVSGKGGAE